ncbi:hypothetical protein [Bacterioplanoides sp.]|uniref:hypothetical protein n=1 Tax=Bacterioplanoides sp. TaxID=2066072 RepID=UPI003B00BFCB
MFTTNSRAAQQARLARQAASGDHKAGKKPCKFCQRSRWLMVITMLIVLTSVSILHTP